ncbi:unnamed protein product [Euphydryas editha]|uniref:Uncharacterized protein n=1 Tax=Euphydryas editha TaxID=104508 RepID=A0AAU9TU40_EUPED|nr:unnamed protein product [Euphydryas editha]
MGVNIIRVLFFYVISDVFCGYQPTGDEVQPGSVLLPATRRGRYLANIVRRQAVDGTGIKFNKDADRMNAEAKKKVDVLSEELLPYIIAEQERRTTLYKRIMTAIQNGEKGVTIAEIRNKPPLLIRKGLLYRCPTNRPPKEPDGSGILMCEEDIEPKQIMYDSCLSAEDKELYVAENKYFFCNRHKIEGPDLPRNGSTVIGCAPIERTSLNYTSNKCALEDTDDVVVHYRYYPDRTYKFVTELDPDREVCDHWNPCQIGYIFSLPSPDQALAASELWQESLEEYVSPNVQSYTSTRKIVIPEGYRFHCIYYQNDEIGFLDEKYYTEKISRCGRFVTLTFHFPEWSDKFYADMFAHCLEKKGSKYKVIPVVNFVRSTVSISPRSMEVHRGQKLNSTSIPYRCRRCRIDSIIVRTTSDAIYTLDTSKYRVRDYIDSQYILEIEVDGKAQFHFGDYFVNMLNEDGFEEKLKVLTVTLIKINRVTTAYDTGKPVEYNVNYSCENCVLSDILCNGESLLSTDKVSITHAKKTITFNLPSFEDSDSCVYMGVFNESGKLLTKVLAVIETVNIPKVEVISSPNDGEQLEYEIPYNCEENCVVESVYLNGVPLETSYRRNFVGSIAFYVVSPTAITIRITGFTSAFDGVYQAVFIVDNEKITKTILEIKYASENSSESTVETSSEEGN